MIRIEHLKKEYPNIAPLVDVNAVVNDGDVISVIGPSGTGKSTLLRCINMLEKPTDGHIWIDDDEITAPKCDINRVRRKMGMVFQSFNLFGHLTVIENIMLAPMDLLGKSKQEAYDECMQLLVSVLDRPRIHAVIEYSEVEEKATMTLRYNGTAYDITREGDPLSVSVLKGIVGGMQYSAASGEYANQVTMEFCL